MAPTGCPECKGEVSATASTCPHCGHPIGDAWGKCPECQGSITATQEFCKECGFPLRPSTKAIPAPPPPAPPPPKKGGTTRRRFGQK